MALSATLTAELTARQTGDNAYDDVFTPSIKRVLQLTDGTGAGEADIIYADERTVSDGSNDDIDLAGSLSNAFGSTITAAEVVAIVAINAPSSGSDNTTDLTIGNATNAFEGFLGGTAPTIGPLKPGATFMLFAGDAAGLGSVTGGSTDELRIANSAGASATYQIAIIARSA